MSTQVRLRGGIAPRYDPLRSETPNSMDSVSSNEMTDQSAWNEARERTLLTQEESILDTEEAMSEIQFDKMAAQIKHLYQPIEFLTSAVMNSLLLFKVSLGLTKNSTIEECFRQLKSSIGDSPGLEIIKTADGPRKLSVTMEIWRTLSDDLQSAVSHFNSMLGSSHKYIGNKELKLTDIQLKLDDIRLLPKTKEKEREYKKLKGIVKQINEFSNDIDSLFSEINSASEVFDHQILTLNGGSSGN